jgi:TM2 domain-containing membrane protein YozV
MAGTKQLTFEGKTTRSRFRGGPCARREIWFHFEDPVTSRPRPKQSPATVSTVTMDDRPTAPPGWYPRPGGGQRFWNGEQWTTGVTGRADSTEVAYPTLPTVPNSAPSQSLQLRPAGSAWGQVAQPTYIVQGPATKSAGTAYLLWIFLGGFAAHRFYLRRTLSAVIFLAVWWVGWATTALGFGILLVAAGAIWLVVDLFLIPDMARRTPV